LGSLTADRVRKIAERGVSEIHKRFFEPDPPDPGLKPKGIRVRALGSPECIRRVEIKMRRRERQRVKRISERGAA
jgi:hypothetical protein